MHNNIPYNINSVYIYKQIYNTTKWCDTIKRYNQNSLDTGALGSELSPSLAITDDARRYIPPPYRIEFDNGQRRNRCPNLSEIRVAVFTRCINRLQIHQVDLY
jgi:hypothetical protein